MQKLKDLAPAIWAITAGLLLVAACALVPVVLLMRLEDDELSRWADIGQAVSAVGVLFSGTAFIGITAALLLQGRELRNQREELSIARDEQARSSELALRELHNDLIKMAIDDSELRSVWPAPSHGQETSRKDHYCNLVLNLQKVAYETHTIDLPELGEGAALPHKQPGHACVLVAEPSRPRVHHRKRRRRGNVHSGGRCRVHRRHHAVGQDGAVVMGTSMHPGHCVPSRAPAPAETPSPACTSRTLCSHASPSAEPRGEWLRGKVEPRQRIPQRAARARRSGEIHPDISNPDTNRRTAGLAWVSSGAIRSAARSASRHSSRRPHIAYARATSV
jgi:hypothetical protein